MSSSVCPNNPPQGCWWTQTKHDFPVDHPYPTRIVIGDPAPGEGGVDDGRIDVILDVVGAIQCGAAVAPPDGVASSRRRPVDR